MLRKQKFEIVQRKKFFKFYLLSVPQKYNLKSAIHGLRLKMARHLWKCHDTRFLGFQADHVTTLNPKMMKQSDIEFYGNARKWALRKLRVKPGIASSMHVLFLKSG